MPFQSAVLILAAKAYLNGACPKGLSELVFLCLFKGVKQSVEGGATDFLEQEGGLWVKRVAAEKIRKVSKQTAIPLFRANGRPGCGGGAAGFGVMDVLRVQAVLRASAAFFQKPHHGADRKTTCVCWEFVKNSDKPSIFLPDRVDFTKFIQKCHYFLHEPKKNYTRRMLCGDKRKSARYAVHAKIRKQKNKKQDSENSGSA